MEPHSHPSDRSARIEVIQQMSPEATGLLLTEAQSDTVTIRQR